MSSPPYPVKAKEGVIPRSTKDVLSGTAGGIAQVLVGQPLDIVKVRLQTSPPGTFTGMADCARQLVKHEGPLAFYKGTLTPLLGVGLCVSIQFGVFERMKREFQGANAKKFGDQSYLKKGLSSSQLYLAGSAAGLSNAVVAGPVEQIRIRLQTQKNNQFRGPLDCARQIIRASGVAGIFRGMIPTFAREGHGMGCYQLLAKTGKTRAEMPAIYAVLFGASSGLAVWLSAYPFDIIKSRLQTDAIDPKERTYKGVRDCAQAIYKQNGIKGFFRGLTPTLVRAPFSNSATFLAVEWAARNLEPYVKN